MHKNNFLISYNLFDSCEHLLAFTTTKQSLNIQQPRFTGNEPSVFKNTRKQLADLLKINKNQLLFPRQTHSTCAAHISSIPISELNETDALITNQPEICICVQTADCVPILLFDSKKNIIAAVHAGWRGTVNNIVSVTVNKMMDMYGSKPNDILAAIGPSISPQVYEVGNDVITTIEYKSPILKNTLINYPSGKTHFNLWEANKILLLECGLANKHIEISEECSFLESHKYFSARRDGTETGRMVSGIMLKK